MHAIVYGVGNKNISQKPVIQFDIGTLVLF